LTARVQDQQAFLAALRHQALTPSTLLRTSNLLPLVRRELITDLPYNALPSLGLAYARVPQARVTHAYIDIASGLVQSGWSSDRQSILLPTTSDGIPALVRRLTHDPALGRMGAGVTVWDGSGTAGLAAGVGTAPRRDGFVVAGVGSTPHAGRTHTVVVRNTLVPGSVDDVTQALGQMLQAPVLARPERGARTPIVVLLGSDTPTAQ